MKTKEMYVDGFVLVVAKKNIAAYTKMAQLGAKVWMKHGALDYKECAADDLKPKGIKHTFAKAMNAKPSETVFFSYITFKSRAHRDAVNAKVMKDPMMNDPKYKDMPMPMDMARMSYGGFKTVVSA